MKRVLAIMMTLVLLAAMAVCTQGLTLEASASEMAIGSWAESEWGEELESTVEAELWGEEEEAAAEGEYIYSYMIPMETVVVVEEIVPEHNTVIIAPDQFTGESWKVGEVGGEGELFAAQPKQATTSFSILLIVLLVLGIGALLLLVLLVIIVGVVLILKKKKVEPVTAAPEEEKKE